MATTYMVWRRGSSHPAIDTRLRRERGIDAWSPLSIVLDSAAVVWRSLQVMSV
jgi:hypothetical protein